MKTTENIVKKLEDYNEAYRSGKPLVSDSDYDQLVEELRSLSPGHPFLQAVEPEDFEGRKEIRHPLPMLSTEKAYTKEALERYINRVNKEAGEIGVKKIVFKVTAKLDGLAGRDDGKIFSSRGNGEVGYEISSAFKKGVVPVGGRGLGLGEIVIVKSYFNTYLSDEFEHPRNMVVGIISSDILNEHAKAALKANMVVFVPYVTLPHWAGTGQELLTEIDEITEDLKLKTDYPLDGMVAEVMDVELKNHMGATAHHYRWQIAIKSKGETAQSIVEDIKWQVGRTGNITPVLEIQPVSLSGATIRRVTAHHAGMVQKQNIGIGSEIEVIRSGEVIPKLEKVISTSDRLIIPEICPVCGKDLEWSNDFLKCVSNECTAQIEQGLSHWFKVLGNADWFGIKTIKKLVEKEYDTLEKIYAMKEKDFIDMGFGPVQSKNLASAIVTSVNKPVEDWRFLAAFGISDLGKGDSRKLLSHIKLKDLIEIRMEDIEKIRGFGAITSRAIANGVKKIKGTLLHMLSLGFNLERTSLVKELADFAGPFAGRSIVFTGKMEKGSREEMQIQARKRGAIVQTSVTGKTDYLVCGQKVGQKKIDKAKKSKARIITESEYFEMIE